MLLASKATDNVCRCVEGIVRAGMIACLFLSRSRKSFRTISGGQDPAVGQAGMSLV